MKTNIDSDKELDKVVGENEKLKAKLDIANVYIKKQANIIRDLKYRWNEAEEILEKMQEVDRKIQ